MVSCQQVFDSDWQLPNTNAGGMMDSSRDRGGNTSQTDFANTARAKGVKFKVGKVEEMDFDGRRVGIYGNHIVGQVAIDGRAVLRIVMRMLEQSHANAHYHCALNLVAACQWIENSSGV